MGVDFTLGVLFQPYLSRSAFHSLSLKQRRSFSATPCSLKMSEYSEETTDTFWRYSNRRCEQAREHDDEEHAQSSSARPSGFEFNNSSVLRPGQGRYGPSLTVPGSPGPTIRSPSTSWRLQPPPRFELDPRVTTPTRNLFTHTVPPPTFRPPGLNPSTSNEPSSAPQHNPFHDSDSDDIDADDGFTDAQRATMMRMRGMNIPMQEATTDAPMQPEDTNTPPIPLGEDGLPRQLTSIDLIARCMDSAKLRAAKERCELVLRRLVSSTHRHHSPLSTPYKETHLLP